MPSAKCWALGRRVLERSISLMAWIAPRLLSHAAPSTPPKVPRTTNGRNPIGDWRWLAVLLQAWLLLQACQCGSSREAPAAAKGGESASAQQARTPNVRSPQAPDLTSTGALSPPFDDGLWRRAKRGDPMDLARLAGRHGAGGLLRAARHGGATARIALAALPYAKDADGSLLALCHWLRGSQGKNRSALLQVIHEVLQRAPSTEEADPPRRDRLCSLTLGEASQDGDETISDLAVSASALLQDRLGR